MREEEALDVQTARTVGSTDTHREQQLALYDGLHRVGHIRLQHERLATTKPMFCGTCLDDQLSLKAVNHDVARGPMHWQATAWLEGEQQQPERSPMNQP